LIGSTEFRDFVDWSLTNKEKIHKWTSSEVKGIFVLQHQGHEMHNITFDTKLRIENINEELNAMDCITTTVKVPHILKRNYRGWDYHKTPEIVGMANEYLEEEFDYLPYDKEV
jgi:hypothetical protein